MPEVPLLNGREAVRVLEKFGWKEHVRKGVILFW